MTPHAKWSESKTHRKTPSTWKGTPIRTSILVSSSIKRTSANHRRASKIELQKWPKWVIWTRSHNQRWKCFRHQQEMPLNVYSCRILCCSASRKTLLRQDCKILHLHSVNKNKRLLLLYRWQVVQCLLMIKQLVKNLARRNRQLFSSGHCLALGSH